MATKAQFAPGASLEARDSPDSDSPRHARTEMAPLTVFKPFDTLSFIAKSPSVDIVRNLSAPACDSVKWKLPSGSWDTHVHVFDPVNYPYDPSHAYSPVPALYPQLLAFESSLARSGEAENIVLVQPSPYGTNNSLVLDKLVDLQDEKSRREVRAIAVIDPDNITDSELNHMQELGVRGVRVNTEATGENVDYGKVRIQIEKAAAKVSRLDNWRCQLFVSGDNWLYLVDTIRDLPIKVIADHQGGMKGLSALPANVTDVTQQTGFAELMSLAKAEKLFIKVSGFYRSSKLTTGGYDDLEPLIRAFAKEVPDQLIWGSDWPHTGSGANRTEANKDVPEQFRIVDDVAVLKNIRKWVGKDVWYKMTVTTPAKVYRNSPIKYEKVLPCQYDDLVLLIQTFIMLHLRRSTHQAARHFSTAVPRLAMQKAIAAAYYRGGTSRAVMFRKDDLPSDQSQWPHIFRSVIGSPDPNGRQLDGMGGGLSSLSKVCVAGPSAESDADVDYTFVAIGVKNDEVDFSSNCGNMTSAVGPFAVDAGLVPKPLDGETSVLIRNTNTNKRIRATFRVEDGEAFADGKFAIDGVAGTASKIRLAFQRPAGSKTGKTLPTGKVVDSFDGIQATCIDVGNPCVFVPASDLGVDGSILADDITAHPTLLSRLDSIRRQAAVAMGIAEDTNSVPGSIPKIAMVSAPREHKLLSGEILNEKSCDVVVRAISVGQPHQAVPITVAMALATASRLSGSTVNECVAPTPVDPDGVTLGHNSGKILVGSTFDEKGVIEEAIVFRTARRLMEGKVYYKQN